jgi:hypothetical protein
MRYALQGKHKDRIPSLNGTYVFQTPPILQRIDFFRNHNPVPLPVPVLSRLIFSLSHFDQN